MGSKLYTCQWMDTIYMYIAVLMCKLTYIIAASIYSCMYRNYSASMALILLSGLMYEPLLSFYS
jgi:hypothetical protein